MESESALIDGNGSAAKALREKRRRRHSEARMETRRRREAERTAGGAEAGSKQRDREWNRGIAAMRRKRARQQREDEIEGRKLRTALRKAARQNEREIRTAAFYKSFEPAGAKIGTDGALLRDLYIDFISRGFASGRPRTNRRGTAANSARTRPYSAGEMPAKIRYIAREDGLEPVEGNILTNMGADLDEAMACAEAIEELERLGPKNAGVYKHIIVGLPYLLTPEQRAELLAELVEPLARMGLPYYATLHSPNPEGDRRNFHAHLICSQRPMTRVGPYQWNFGAGKFTWLDTSEATFLQRRIVARSFNRALARAGQEVRWTSKSRASRGLPSPGNNKKGAERTRAERKLAATVRELGSAHNDLVALERHIEQIAALEAMSERFERAFDSYAMMLAKAAAAEADAASKARADAETAEAARAAEAQRRRDDQSQRERVSAAEPLADKRPAKQKPSEADRLEAMITARAAQEAQARAAARRQQEAARLREKRRQAEKREWLRQFEARICQGMEGMGVEVNNPAAFAEVRRAVQSYPQVVLYSAPTWTGEKRIFYSDDRWLLSQINAVEQSEGGRFYLLAVGKHLNAPADENTRLWRTLVDNELIVPPDPAPLPYRGRRRNRDAQPGQGPVPGWGRRRGRGR